MERLRQHPPVVASEWHYAAPAVALHWLLAALIVAMVTIGHYMTSIEDDPGADAWFNLHKSIGLVVFALVLLRIGWRLGHRPQPLPASMPRWQVLAASAVQWLLNACLLLLPVTGFLGASYTRSGVVFFGLHLPAWRAPDHDTAELFFSVHQALGWILVWLVTVHLLAALKHLLLDRDRVFQRMWF